MRKWVKELYLGWETLNCLAGQHIPMMMVQIVVYCAVSCYNVVVAPFIIAQVYQALETGSMELLYKSCAIGGGMIVLVFVLCYFQNVYLDLNSFRITLTSTENACRHLFELGYDRVNRKFTQAEILNRIDACTDCISGIFPLCVSILSNVISILILLFMAGRFSLILLLLAVLTAEGSYLAAKYESGKKERYEKRKQAAMDKTGGLLEHTIYHIAFSRIYGQKDQAWNVYQECREEAWQAKWGQEQAGMYAGSILEAMTSCLRAFLGWNLFHYYRKEKIASQKVAASFSVFDQLKAVVSNFLQPVSALRISNIAVQRFADLRYIGEKSQPEETMRQEGPVISLAGVSYGVNDKHILRDVSISIVEGEKVAILGANGCGKSTLMRIMAGLCQPDTGTVMAGNRPPGELHCKELRERITYIPATSYMYGQSVSKNILMSSDHEKETDFQRVCMLAHLVEEQEEGILEQSALEISGGQKQRVNIARGLLHHAPILLADEPEAGLPQAQGYAVIKSILQNSDTAVIITHNFQELELFTRVLILKDGIVAIDGTPQEIMRSQEYLEWIGTER